MLVRLCSGQQFKSPFEVETRPLQKFDLNNSGRGHTQSFIFWNGKFIAPPCLGDARHLFQGQFLLHHYIHLHGMSRGAQGACDGQRDRYRSLRSPW